MYFPYSLNQSALPLRNSSLLSSITMYHSKCWSLVHQSLWSISRLLARDRGSALSLPPSFSQLRPSTVQLCPLNLSPIRCPWPEKSEDDPVFTILLPPPSECGGNLESQFQTIEGREEQGNAIKLQPDQI